MECVVKEEVLVNGELECCVANSSDAMITQDQQMKIEKDLSFEQHVKDLESVTSVDVKSSDPLNVSSQDVCEIVRDVQETGNTEQSQVVSKTSQKCTEPKQLNNDECQSMARTVTREAVKVCEEVVDSDHQELTPKLPTKVAFKLYGVIGHNKKLHGPANISNDQLMGRGDVQITSMMHNYAKSANQNFNTVEPTKPHTNVDQKAEKSHDQVDPLKSEVEEKRVEIIKQETIPNREKLKRTYNQHIVVLKPNSKIAMEKKRMKLIMEEIESDTKEQSKSTSVSTVSSETKGRKKMTKKHDQADVSTEKKLVPDTKNTPRDRRQSAKEAIKAQEKLKKELLAQSLTELFYPQVIIGPNSIKQIAPPDNISSKESIKVICSKSISSKLSQPSPSQEKTVILENVQQNVDLPISSQRAEIATASAKHPVNTGILSPTAIKNSRKSSNEKKSRTQNQIENLHASNKKQTTSSDTSLNKLEVTSKRVAEKIKHNISPRKIILIDLPASKENAEISSESEKQTPTTSSETNIKSSKKSSAARITEKRKENYPQKKLKLDDKCILDESISPEQLSHSDIDKQFNINLSLEEMKWIIESIELPRTKEITEILSPSIEQTPTRKSNRRHKSLSSGVAPFTNDTEETPHLAKKKMNLSDLPMPNKQRSLEISSDDVNKQFIVKLSLEEMKWIIKLMELPTHNVMGEKSLTYVEQSPKTVLEESIRSSKKTAVMSKHNKEEIACSSSIDLPIIKKTESQKKSPYIDIFDRKVGIKISPLKIIPQLTTQVMDATTQVNKTNVSVSRQLKFHPDHKKEMFNVLNKNINKKKKNKTAKKNVSPPKQKAIKSINYEKFFNVSLPKKWQGLVIERKSGSSGGKFDVYIYSPDGKQLRSRAELTKYLKENNITNLKPDDFKFSVNENKKLTTKSPSTTVPTPKEKIQQKTLNTNSPSTTVPTPKEKIQQKTLNTNSPSTTVPTPKEKIQQKTLNTKSPSTTVPTPKEKIQQKTLVQKSATTFGEQELSKCNATRSKSLTSVDTSPHSKKKDVGKLKVSFKFSPKNKQHKHDESLDSKKNLNETQKRGEEKTKKDDKTSQDKFYKEILQGKRISIPLVKCDDLIANFNSETNTGNNTSLADHNLKDEPTPAAVPEEAVPKLSEVPQPESANLNLNTCDAGNIQGQASHQKIWVPPKSPYGIIYESLYQDVWKLLIATIIIENASASNGNAMVWKLFENYPTLDSIKNVSYGDLNDFFKVLDNPERCTKKIKAFIKEIETKAYIRPSELKSIDKYGNDAYKLFCTGEWREVRPTDMDLHLYHCWLAQNSAKLGV